MKRVALLVAIATLLPCDADAYVRSRTSKGTPTRWESGCVIIQPDSTGSPDLDATLTFATIRESMQIWVTATASCAYLALSYIDPAPLDAHFDGTNTIKFRTDKWCHPDDSQSHNICYSSVAAGITTVYYIDRPGDEADGVILDADIELNNLDFTFDFVDPVTGPTKTARPGTTLADFENTLVHELGHLHGLDHTCADSATPAVEVDDTGSPPPSCDALSKLSASARQKITEATMFNSAAPAEIKKRSPEADDVAGICNAYPISQKPPSCRAADIGAYTKKGCEMGRGPLGGPLMLWLSFALLFAATRRRASLD